MGAGLGEVGGGVWALCVYWEEPRMRVQRLNVHKSSVSVRTHTPHTTLTPTAGPPGSPPRVKSSRKAVSQNTKVAPLQLFSAAAFPPLDSNL